MSFDKKKGLHYTYIYFDNISDLLEKEEVIKRKLRFERSLGDITSILLSNDANAVDLALQQMIDISRASRVYIFKNFRCVADKLCMRQIYEVCKAGINPEIDNPELQHISYLDDGYARWMDILSKNGIVTGNISDFPESERRVLESQDIKTIVIIPLVVNHNWYGFIGLDFTEQEVVISESDMRLIKTAASLFGAYFSNKSYVELITNQNLNLKDENQDKDRFVEILAHDLKNSFNNLLYTTDFINSQFDVLEKERVQNLVSSINMQAQNSFNLLNDLLIWSSTRTGKLSLNCNQCDVKSVIEEVVQDLNSVAEKKKIDINYTVSDPSFCGDRMVVKTIIRNLLRNAVKFTHFGGKVDISAKKVNGKEYNIIVKDNGVGISKENLEKIWNPSINFSTKGTANEHGSGMGLILCKELVDKHNGEILVESTPGKGSTFHIKLMEC